MSNLFRGVNVRKPQKSWFDLSHERKMSFDMADLVPIMCEPVMPGDVFKVRSEIMMRLAPMMAPMMHRVNVYTHWFFVPNRLVWQDWEKFITGGEQGTANYTLPYVNAGGTTYYKNGTLADFMGLATTSSVTESQKLNALPFRGYQMIYNEYFRNQNVQDEIPIDLSDGGDAYATSMLTMRKRNWEKDYFTGCLPWTQRGGDVPVPGDITLNTEGTTQTLVDASGTVKTNADLGTDGSGNILNTTAPGTPGYIDPNGSFELNSTINDLRRATRMQEFLEILARTGSRYKEVIRSMFGVNSSDARLDRPEYLGGGRSPVTISEVLQTSSTDSTSPQGTMAGHGVSIGQHGFGKKFFEEHGYVIGIVSVMPKTAYMQGTRRHFRYNDRFDFPWPKFAQIGEQPVYDYELYNDYSKTEEQMEENVFGYNPRYSEFKFIPSSVHGEFKDSLDLWHMSRKFTSQPALNNSFVTGDPTTRVFAVEENAEHLYAQIYNDVKAKRPLPFWGTPTL